MITRFFSTSRPIHLVLISLAVFVLFVLLRIAFNPETLNGLRIVEEIGVFVSLWAAIVIFGFYVSKNGLTLHNGYKFLFYGLFIFILPETILNSGVLLANLSVIFALRRIFSLKNNLRIKKKLFDAGFWIAVASMIYFGTLLYLGLVFVAILLLTVAKINDWVIPLTGFLSVLIIMICYLIISGNTIDSILDFIHAPNYDFSVYNNLEFVIGITVLISFSVWAMFFYVKSFREKLKAERSSHHLVIFNFIIAMILVVISPVKDGSEFIFLFPPAAIIMSNYVENTKEKWFSEIFVWLLIITPIVRLML